MTQTLSLNPSRVPPPLFSPMCPNWAVFRSIFQNSKNFVNRLHGVLNIVEKIALHKWTVNREMNLMNLIKL